MEKSSSYPLQSTPAAPNISFISGTTIENTPPRPTQPPSVTSSAFLDSGLRNSSNGVRAGVGISGAEVESRDAEVSPSKFMGFGVPSSPPDPTSARRYGQSELRDNFSFDGSVGVNSLPNSRVPYSGM